MESHKEIVFLFLSILLLAFLLPPTSFAQELEDASVSRERPEIKITPLPHSKNVQSPILNKDLKAPYLRSRTHASLSTNNVFFGVIIPGEPLLRSQTLEMKGPGYSVSAFEDHELTSSESAEIIPDTSCDEGNCDFALAAVWKEPLTYGFGYRCTTENDTGCLPDFSAPDSFRPFANLQKKQLPEIIAESENGQKMDIQYKVNISPTLGGKQYQNVIYYIISPEL